MGGLLLSTVIQNKLFDIYINTIDYTRPYEYIYIYIQLSNYIYIIIPIIIYKKYIYIVIDMRQDQRQIHIYNKYFNPICTEINIYLWYPRQSWHYGVSNYFNVNRLEYLGWDGWTINLNIIKVYQLTDIQIRILIIYNSVVVMFFIWTEIITKSVCRNLYSLHTNELVIS